MIESETRALTESDTKIWNYIHRKLLGFIYGNCHF